MDFVFKTTTTMNYDEFVRNIEARQGPADGVTPVFTPTNPSVLSSRFVFFQDTFLYWLNVLLWTLQLNSFLPTISAKVLFFIAMQVSKQMLCEVE